MNTTVTKTELINHLNELADKVKAAWHAVSDDELEHFFGATLPSGFNGDYKALRESQIEKLNDNMSGIKGELASLPEESEAIDYRLMLLTFLNAGSSDEFLTEQGGFFCAPITSVSEHEERNLDHIIEDYIRTKSLLTDKEQNLYNDRYTKLPRDDDAFSSNWEEYLRSHPAMKEEDLEAVSSIAAVPQTLFSSRSNDGITEQNTSRNDVDQVNFKF